MGLAVAAILGVLEDKVPELDEDATLELFEDLCLELPPVDLSEDLSFLLWFCLRDNSA
jgi:hypothetical protein